MKKKNLKDWLLDIMAILILVTLIVSVIHYPDLILSMTMISLIFGIFTARNYISKNEVPYLIGYKRKTLKEIICLSIGTSIIVAIIILIFCIIIIIYFNEHL